ncbi:MAG: amino acid permease [Planctomycetaceae bacterium]|nr:amino acid permease [Planctomycetaceae bacterium]
MSQDPRSNTKFGTFGGVFTPCTLTILGVIMFLRLGQVVGQSGIVYALLIVAASKAITTLTTLSLSAIATNTRVQGGGAYYLISRSLGVEFGGAIGVVFYLAQAISVAMYVIGFTEAFTATFPSLTSNSLIIATLVNILTFVCVYIGAGWTMKVQYFILGMLAAALLSFYAGAFTHFDLEFAKANLTPKFEPGESLFTMFALFFPAVTGIMAGANMSGDLARPSKSIPRGTLASVAVTGLVYVSMAILLGCVCPREELITNNMVIQEIAVIPALITAGVFAATLSSALGSMMGAPRILQAFARDEIFEQLKFFGASSGRSREPRRATVLTFVIAQSCIFLGDLNAIAPIITMFFMITYGLLNLATFYEAVTHNPSYRPTFKYCHWTLSLAGTLGCLTVMFLINWQWAILSIVVIAALHWFIRFREIESRWGDLSSGVIFERARQNLLRLEQTVYHPKNWRPVILALSGSAWTRPHLAIYGHWLTAGHGILSLAHIVTGDIEEHAERRQKFEATLHAFIAREGLQAFPTVVISQYLSDGIESLVQCHGIGGLRPNTVLLGWPNEPRKAETFGASVRLVSRLGRSIIAVRFRESRGEDTDSSEDDDSWQVPRGTIDVWWRGRRNGGLMLLLAHLLHQNPEWRRNPIRMLRVVPSEDGKSEVTRHVEELCTSARIAAQAEVVVSTNPASAIQATSAEAAVVLLGFETPREGDEAEFFSRMENLVGNLPRVLFVDSAGGMELES